MKKIEKACRNIGLALLLCLAAYPLAASMAPPPIPPIGWEERLTPGFDPPIESTIVKLRRGELKYPEAAEEVWTHWSADAVQVLLQLLQDEAWKEFQDMVVRVLLASPHAEAKAWADETVQQLGTQEITEENRLLLYPLFHAYSQRYPEDMKRLKEEFLKTGNSVAHSWALQQLLREPTADSVNRAAALVAELVDADEKRSLEYQIDRARGHVRAQQFMDADAITENNP